MRGHSRGTPSGLELQHSIPKYFTFRQQLRAIVPLSMNTRFSLGLFMALPGLGANARAVGVLPLAWFHLLAIGVTTVGNALRGVPLAPERHGGRSLQDFGRRKCYPGLNHALPLCGSSGMIPAKAGTPTARIGAEMVIVRFGVWGLRVRASRWPGQLTKLSRLRNAPSRRVAEPNCQRTSPPPYAGKRKWLRQL